MQFEPSRMSGSAISENAVNPRISETKIVTNYQDQRRRALEHQTFEAGKREWAKKRFGKPLAQTLDVGRENEVYDRFVREYLQEEGLIPRDEAAPQDI